MCTLEKLMVGLGVLAGIGAISSAILAVMAAYP